MLDFKNYEGSVPEEDARRLGLGREYGQAVTNSVLKDGRHVI